MIHAAIPLLVAVTAALPHEITAPSSIVVATVRGEAAIPVALHRGHPALAAMALGRVLPLESHLKSDLATVLFAGQAFQFPLGSPAFLYQGRVTPLVGGAYIVKDTLFLPLQWLAQTIPQIFHEAYRYDPLAARFEEARILPAVARASAARPPLGRRAPEAAARLGLRWAHRVVVDPGHGGKDSGTPGRYLPRGVQEKHVTLAIARTLRAELDSRGIEGVLTRTSDVFVPVSNRAPVCRDDCDLFISIHVNQIGRREVRGLETYFFEERLTADVGRVAAMENEYLRYETDLEGENEDPLAFIMKDLERNEYLRESAQLAELVHDRVARIHPGGARRVAQDNFEVLRVASRPAVLVETGYGSNPNDGAFLASQEGQRKIAVAIADGIVEYLLRYESKIESTRQ